MNKMMMMRFDWFFALALLVSLYFPLEAATRELQQQEIGTEICYCAPNSYEFTLDFLLTCPPVNITLGDAVAATTCMVSPFGDPEVSDLVPVSVQSIDILELNQNLQVIIQENIVGDFIDGDTFSYISYAAIPGMIVNPEDLPRAIQLNIVGVNKDGEEIINVYLITFTNACGAYPVLSEGQFAGWTRFSDLGPPDQEYCPAAPSPAPAPIPMMSMSMSMNMDMNFKSLTLEDSFSIGDYLDGTMDIMKGGDSSSEFGHNDQNRNRDGIFSNRRNHDGIFRNREHKNSYLKKSRLGSLPISGVNPNNPDPTDITEGDMKSVVVAEDDGEVESLPISGDNDNEYVDITKDDSECDDYPCKKEKSLPTSESKNGKTEKSTKKGGKSEKYEKSDYETKKEKNETKKEKTKLQKSEKDATKSEKKRLRI